ncbi:type II toxin-antitoxin system HipA family toxin [Fundidesulfovibrio putealis]|uniref:type II toxin-antitoxin system HipA family toxin n=1 Tax=Fundidesulfovibrio putealis TaxID=270496 RepID=UPI00040519AA|nr:type II toxin-antitoxin system HipA family toxin [Fundidesulfovibrio putealis]
MTSDRENAVVFVSLTGVGYVPAGVLTYIPKTDQYIFGYGRRYLEREDAVPLDPVLLPLRLKGSLTFRTKEGLPNVFRDASPDSWARKILSIYAPRHPDTMTQFELLTAVHEPLRTGGMAFGPDASGPRSMADWHDGPPLMRPVSDLEKMAHLVRLVEKHAQDDTLPALRQELSDPIMKAMAFSFSALGGSRPKAFYRSNDGREWIAKFPKLGDAWNDPRIEFATMNLAKRCGIETANTSMINVNNYIDVLLVQRFDRDNMGIPKHFISGFTLGNLPLEGDWKSYQHLSETARRHGNVKVGGELFKRMAFNVLCSNRDDHPKQQSFFVERTHVAITPAYDITPAYIANNSNEYDLALACGKQKNPKAATLENILSWTEPFGLRREEARAILNDMLSITRQWREFFFELGVSSKDIEEVACRFIQAERELPTLAHGLER